MYAIRLYFFVTAVTVSCLSILLLGEGILFSIVWSVCLGFCILGCNDNAVRFSLALVTNFYTVSVYACHKLSVTCPSGSCSLMDFSSVLTSIFTVAGFWGVMAGSGLCVSFASGLALVNITKYSDTIANNINHIIQENASKTVGLEEWDINVFFYLTLIGAAGSAGSILYKVLHIKWCALMAISPIVFSTVLHGILGPLHVSLRILFLISVMTSTLVANCLLEVGRRMMETQNPGELQLSTFLAHNMVKVHLPGVGMGVIAGHIFLDGTMSLNNFTGFLENLAILSFILVLSKAVPIFLLMAPKNCISLYEEKLTDEKEKLHQCFKLRVRDFAGQTVYHSIHQPFLPRYGIYVCVFSWKRAQEFSLRHAKREPAGPDKCLDEILFWLKNISMHRLRPNTKDNSGNAMDRKNLKNILLVGTHSSQQSCDLTTDEKTLITDYYLTELENYPEIYSCLDMDTGGSGVISVENRHENDEGIMLLKSCLLQAAAQVVNLCFPEPMPVQYWCWLKESRDRCERLRRSPIILLSESYIDKTGHYMPVYPRNNFKSMLQKLVDIGEIFLVCKDDHECFRSPCSDYFVILDVQFLVDFMKDLINIDSKKKLDREHRSDWVKLRRKGKSKIRLLRHHLTRFLETRNIDSEFVSLSPLQQPLVKSMQQLDFLFIVGDEFFIPQLLPTYSQIRNPNPIHKSSVYYFREVNQTLWEHLFDFQEFDFHHEYIFFRLITRCVNMKYCKEFLCRDWAAFSLTNDLERSLTINREASHWFTLACEKKGYHGATRNIISLRVSADMDRQESLVVLRNVTGI